MRRCPIAPFAWIPWNHPIVATRFSVTVVSTFVGPACKASLPAVKTITKWPVTAVVKSKYFCIVPSVAPTCARPFGIHCYCAGPTRRSKPCWNSSDSHQNSSHHCTSNHQNINPIIIPTRVVSFASRQPWQTTWSMRPWWMRPRGKPTFLDGTRIVRRLRHHHLIMTTTRNRFVTMMPRLFLNMTRLGAWKPTCCAAYIPPFTFQRHRVSEKLLSNNVS